MPDQRHIAWFDRHDPATEPVLGGKNTSLGILTMAGLPVPPGFAITAAAYREAFRDSGIDGTLAAMMADLDPEDAAVLTRVAAEARGTIVDAGLPAWLTDQVDGAYAVLSERTGQDEVPVAVRSSATCEDQPDASFAGEHDTYLWVAVRRRGPGSTCCAAGRASTPIGRSPTAGRWRTPRTPPAMSVGVQQMVLPRSSGVAFTLNPRNGDRSQIAIDAVVGPRRGGASRRASPRTTTWSTR